MTIEPDYGLLPEHMRDGMRRYLEDGIVPGSFMRWIICNDFVSAWRNADRINRHELGAYAEFCLYYMPANSWGSEKTMLAWSEDGGAKAIRAAREVRT